MTKVSEGQFQKKVIKFLKDHDIWYVKYWGGAQFTKEGVPDILACINGEFHGIELKSDGTSYNETKLQGMNLDRINHSGGAGYVLRPTKVPPIKHKEFDYFCINFEQWKARWFKDDTV
ncbi:hypothetical protein [Pediococcus pentosaceus]|uniref:hypothetical protein n=1 Tax=Pediococcus pentosaceus TaxID=1255 RepID=UPI001F596C0C|nr:hypothetical protein [Pediococcus pentosaceus]MCI2960310.1 hypothetical protein [Pediococcus pentosaceus]